LQQATLLHGVRKSQELGLIGTEQFTKQDEA
jgi:hypothetical protein